MATLALAGTAVGCVDRILRLALDIKEVVDTARQNKGDCKHVASRVETLSETVLLYRENAEVVNSKAVRAALEVAESVLAEALAVVKDCRKERSILRALWVARRLSRELSKAEGRIAGATGGISCAVDAYSQAELARQKPQDQQQALAVLTGGPNITLLRSAPQSLPQKISQVAREIKDAAETVHQEKADFMEMERCASSVSAFLSPLEKCTELVNQETMRDALNRLLATFCEARSLVLSYHHSGTRISIILCQYGKPVKEPRDMLSQMLGDISAVNIIVMNGLHGLKRDQGAGTVKDHIQVIQDDLQDSDVPEVATSAQDQEIKST